MEKQDSNPVLSPLVRYFMCIVVVVVLFGGALFFLPGFVGSFWPWPLAPFNARFLGSVYLAELTIVVMLVVSNRWAPGRIILPMALSFTLIVSIISLFYLSRFDWQRSTTWLWFILYFISAGASAYFLWRYRRLPPAQQSNMSAAWRSFLLAQGIVLGGYGIGLLLAPTVFTQFWPWRIDEFHGRIYSAIFLTGATGSFLIWKSAAAVEMRALGVAQIAFGFCAISGLVIADAALHQVNWSLLGGWFWVGGFTALLLAGLVMLWQSRASQVRRSQT